MVLLRGGGNSGGKWECSNFELRIYIGKKLEQKRKIYLEINAKMSEIQKN